MNGEGATPWEIRLPDKNYWYTGLVAAEPLSNQHREVGEVLGHDDAAISNGIVEDLCILRTGELDAEDGHGLVPTVIQLVGGRPGKHLVEQPPHPVIKRSRRLTSSCSADAARASAAIRSSISSGNAT